MILILASVYIHFDYEIKIPIKRKIVTKLNLVLITWRDIHFVKKSSRNFKRKFT